LLFLHFSHLGNATEMVWGFISQGRCYPSPHHLGRASKGS
jgi:hypothetical protein